MSYQRREQTGVACQHVSRRFCLVVGSVDVEEGDFFFAQGWGVEGHVDGGGDGGVDQTAGFGQGGNALIHRVGSGGAVEGHVYSSIAGVLVDGFHGIGSVEYGVGSHHLCHFATVDDWFHGPDSAGSGEL